MNHEGVSLSRLAGESNETVLNSLVDECKPVNKAGTELLREFVGEAHEAPSEEDKRIRYTMKKKPGDDMIIELLRRLHDEDK